jgi:hypothetical protein
LLQTLVEALVACGKVSNVKLEFKGSNSRNTLTEALRSRNCLGTIGVEDQFNLGESVNRSLVIEGASPHTLIGLPSTGMPLHSSTALVALSERAKTIFAIPRLAPPGPYDNSTFLTGPMILAKYSYLSQGLVSDLDIVHGMESRESRRRSSERKEK